MKHHDHARNTTSVRGIRALESSLLLCLLLCCGNAVADDEKADNSDHNGWKIANWRLQTSLYNHHWSENPDHNNHPRLIAAEAVFENNWLAGGAFFHNSFGQPSEFVYMGYQWPLFHSKYWYFQLVGGLIHGYKDSYQDKIPLNGLGVAPAILPIFGFRYKWAFTQLTIEGTASITVTAGIAF